MATCYKKIDFCHHGPLLISHIALNVLKYSQFEFYMNTSIFDNPRMFNFLNSRGLYIDLSAQACNGADVLSEDGGLAKSN